MHLSDKETISTVFSSQIGKCSCHEKRWWSQLEACRVMCTWQLLFTKKGQLLEQRLKTAGTFLSEVNNRETTVATEVNNDMNCE